ncbi:hypothetical protein XAB3213_4280001 [Xanthomonas citri pv. bilvae]|nr:hypothetical protein XAB3213_4280001 [Xanthomonas citri pv. bilvae]
MGIPKKLTPFFYVTNEAEQWINSLKLRGLAFICARELPPMQASRNDPIGCRLVIYAKSRTGLRLCNRRSLWKSSRASSA